MSTDITSTVRGRVPRLPYEKLAEVVLGPSYQLSLVVCGDSLARRINTEYRKKSYKPNVLSFPLSRSEGEIFLNVRTAEREAAQLGVSLRSRLALLFVHGLFHLKGHTHGKRMEKAEQNILRQFKLL
jgi:rRNA maturation RNase YbeY